MNRFIWSKQKQNEKHTRSHSLSWRLSSGWQWGDQHELRASGVCCSHAAHMDNECWCSIDQSESIYSQGGAKMTPATQHNAHSYCTGAENMLELCWYLTVQIIHLICAWCVTDKLINTQTRESMRRWHSTLGFVWRFGHMLCINSVITLASFFLSNTGRKYTVVKHYRV